MAVPKNKYFSTCCLMTKTQGLVFAMQSIGPLPANKLNTLDNVLRIHKKKATDMMDINKNSVYICFCLYKTLRTGPLQTF